MGLINLKTLFLRTDWYLANWLKLGTIYHLIMATVMENFSAFTTKVLFNVKDLGIRVSDCNKYNTSMTKYLCVRESKSVVIIDMTKPKQPIKLPITDHYIARFPCPIMNPDSPILAFPVRDQVGGILQDQLQIYDVEAKTTLKSYTIAEMVEFWKWITPKLLALITHKAIYHWSIEGSTGPVKLTDMPDMFSTSHSDLKIGSIWDYIQDPSQKWLAFIGRDLRDINYRNQLFVRSYQGGDQWLRFDAHAAAFTNFNIEENHSPSTMLCCAEATGLCKLELSVSDPLVANSVSRTWFWKEPELGKKQSTVLSRNNKAAFPLALQISQNYGLIYLITRGGQIFIYDLETAQAICSYIVSDRDIVWTIEGPTSGSFYSINTEGQVLLTNVNDSTILSFVSDKLKEKGDIVTKLEKSLQRETKKKEETEERLLGVRGELNRCQVLNQEISKKNEGLNKQKTDVQNESARIKRDLEKSLTKLRETEKQLFSKITWIYKYRMLENQMLNEIKELKKEKAEQQNEKSNITRKREETEEQLASIRIKMLSEIEELKNENAKLQNQRNKLQVETNVQREIEQFTSKMTELKNYQVSQNEMLNRLEQLTIQNTQLINQNIELTKENHKIVGNLTKSIQVEQDARRETEQQLESKKLEIDDYKKSQEELKNKIEDFRLLKESNNLEANFTEYSHEELRKVTNDFHISLKIGEGGYGPVYKAFIGLKPVAIKILKHESSHGNKQFSQEVEILSRVRHPNLVMLFGACQEAQALIYELLPNGSLYDVLRNEQTRNALTSKIRICIASNICSALVVLHSAKPHGIVHGDLKSANILLDSNYMGKLSDFGICRNLEKTDSRNTAHHYTDFLKGTPGYWDPELFNAGEMTVQCDVYAFGIILLELVTGRDPRGLKDQVEEALNKGGNLIVDPSAGEWPLEEAKKMIQLGLRCSELSRKKRPNLEKEVCSEIESMLRASLHF